MRNEFMAPIILHKPTLKTAMVHRKRLSHFRAYPSHASIARQTGGHSLCRCFSTRATLYRKWLTELYFLYYVRIVYYFHILWSSTFSTVFLSFARFLISTHSTPDSLLPEIVIQIFRFSAFSRCCCCRCCCCYTFVEEPFRALVEFLLGIWFYEFIYNALRTLYRVSVCESERASEWVWDWKGAQWRTPSYNSKRNAHTEKHTDIYKWFIGFPLLPRMSFRYIGKPTSPCTPSPSPPLPPPPLPSLLHPTGVHTTQLYCFPCLNNAWWWRK